MCYVKLQFLDKLLFLLLHESHLSLATFETNTVFTESESYMDGFQCLALHEAGGA